MASKIKTIENGNSLGVDSPKETLAALRVQKGGKLTLIEAQVHDAGKPIDPEFAKTMEVFNSLTQRYRKALQKLAK